MSDSILQQYPCTTSRHFNQQSTVLSRRRVGEILSSFCINVCLLWLICCSLPVATAFPTPNIPVNWIQGMGDGVTFYAMTNVPSTNEIAVVGTMNRTLTDGSPLMNNVLNVGALGSLSFVGFLSLMKSDGTPSWTILVDFTPYTVSLWQDRLFVAGATNNAGPLHQFSLAGDSYGSAALPNTMFYGSSVDPVTNILYFTGTMRSSNDTSCIFVSKYDAPNLIEEIASSVGGGKNVGMNLAVHNGTMGLGLSTESSVTMGGKVMSPTTNSTSFYVLVDLNQKTIIEVQQYGDKAPLVTSKQPDSHYSLSFDGTRLYDYSDSLKGRIFSNSSSGSLEIYGINGRSSDFLVVTGKVFGTVNILGQTTISSSDLLLSDGFVCKISYPIGSTVICETFGSMGLTESGRLITVDTIGNIIIAAQTSFSNSLWSGIVLPSGYGNLIVSLGTMSNTSIILSQHIVMSTNLETNYRYLINRPIKVTNNSLAGYPGAELIFSGNGALSLLNATLHMQGSLTSHTHIRSLNAVSQPKITSNSSQILLVYVVCGKGITLQTREGRSLVISYSRFEEVDEYAIQTQDTENVEIKYSNMSSNNSSVNPIIYIKATGSSSTTDINDNLFQIDGNAPIMEVVSKNSASVSITKNQFVGMGTGVKVDSEHGQLSITGNRFANLGDPLNVKTKADVGTVNNNEFTECTGAVTINKQSEGQFYIQKNTFQRNNASCILSFETVNCSQPILIESNIFSNNLIFNQVVSLKFPTIGCVLSDFRNNKIADNTILPGFNQLVDVTGGVKIHRNYFQFKSGSFVLNNRGSSVVNAQFNFWGTIDPVQVRMASGNPSSTLRNISSIYGPYLNQNGDVIEVDFFTNSEKRNIVDCQSVREIWPDAPSAVYRINPFCQSMLVLCRMTVQTFTVLQRRQYRDASFNVGWTKYEDGFGSLDGDFFLGLKKFSLLNRVANYTVIDYWTSHFDRTSTFGSMKIGSSDTDYALTINTNALSYTNVPFGTADHSSDSVTLACATQHLSGWWFGNCSSPSSWNLNAIMYSVVSLVKVRNVTGIVVTDWKLASAAENRNLMVCDSPITCFNIPQNSSDVCSGKGYCSGVDTCVCNPGFSGLDCSPITVSIGTSTSIQFCNNIEFTTYTSKFNSSYTYVWSMYNDDGMKPGVGEYLSSQTSRNIILPARYFGFSSNIIQVKVIHDGITIGQARTGFIIPKPVVDSKNIDVGDSQLYLRQFEVYPLVLRTKNLPVCASETKKWTVNGREYQTLENSVTIDFVPTLSETLYITLALFSSIVQTNVSVTVVPARPVTIISGGNRMVTAFHNHTIDASKSYDITVSNNVTSRFYWSCVGCKNFMSSNRSTVLFNEDVGIYTLSVIYYPDSLVPSRKASSQVTLTVIDDLSDMPIPEISTTLPDLLDARNKLRIEPSVSKNRPNHLLDYEWIVLRKEKNEITVISGSSYNVVPLVLSQGFLKPNSSYVFTYRVRYRNFTNKGEVSVSAKTASASLIQVLSCSPCNGTALQTQFEFSIGATDLIEYYPLQYSFSYLDPSSKRYIPLQTISNSPTIQTILPNLNSKHIIVQGTVTNFFGIESIAQLNISLTDIDTTNILQDLISNLNDQSSNDILTSITGSLSTTKMNNESEKIVGSVLSFMSDRLDRETKNSSISISSATININAIETLTKLTTASMTLNVTSSSHLLVDKIIDLCAQGNLELRDSTTDSLARAVSNLMVRYDSEGTHQSNPMISTISKISAWVASSKWISENQTNIVTDTYQLSVKKETGDTIRGTDIYTNDVQVTIPRNISVLSSEQVYVVQSVSFNHIFNPYLLTSSNFSTPVVDFEIKQGETKVKLMDLDYPLEIVLNKEVEKENSSFRFECRFMDENTNSSWFTDGCWLYKEDEKSVTCHCSHTTSFSAMIIYDPKAPNKASDGLYITSIIVNSFFALICIVLLVMSIVWKRKQPIKSRFLAPYIGLGAIIVECVLNGIIRNSLLIAANSEKDYRGINSIAYLILTIVNPVVLLSLFIYFWQMLRYFFLKNLYAIMDVEKRNLKKIRFLKMLSSKLVYVVLGSLVFAASCTYFVVISILEATNVIKANAASTVNALSFSLMSLLLGALIVATFIWDCTIILSRKLFRRELKKMSEGNADVEYLKRIVWTFVNHFKSDDPLMFRIESVFMVSAMIVMTVSYIVGISDRFDSRASPNSAAKIIEFLFDILYISLRIMAFGGLSTLVRFIQRVKLHREHEDYSRLKQYMSELKTGTSTIESQLQNMLRDEYGYLAISTYAKKEFALENIILWKRLEDVRSESMTSPAEKRKKYLQDLYDDCIARGSPYECNLPSKVVKNYRKVLAQQDDITAADAEEVFLGVSNEVLVNICDTFTRFSVSPEYAHYQHVRGMSKELHDRNFNSDTSSRSQ